MLKGLQDDWRSVASTMLVVSFVVLLPAKTLFNVPILAMALAGAILWIRNGWQLLPRQSWQWLLVLFGCVWVPMLIASVDAVDPGRSLKSIGLYPRFLLAGIFVLWALRDQRTRRWVTLVTFGLCAFWAIDAMVQAISGRNILWDEFVSGRLKGIFAPKYRLGLSLAVFLPLVMDIVFRQRLVHPAWGLLLPVVLAVIAMTLHRNSWVMAVFAMVAYGFFAIAIAGWRPRWQSVLLGIVCICAIAVMGISNKNVSIRLQGVVQALTTEPERLEAQLGQRPDIWRAALRMFESNLLTGVGPRGFKSAYEAYAVGDDYWINLKPPQIPTHPHQTLLEIAAETGVLGIIGFIGWWLVLGLAWVRAKRASALLAAPWLLGFSITVFPANISKAFSSSATASLAWWLLLVGLAFLSTPDGNAAKPKSTANNLPA